MSKEYDFIVIGGGSGGYAAARTALEYTNSVAVVDGSKELGGLCILRGCMPSKTLIYSAEVLHHAQMADKFGLNIPEATVDMKRLHERKLKTIGEFAEYRQEQLTDGRFDLYRAKASFTGPNQIALDNGDTLTGKKILVATGSVVSYPPIKGLDSVPVWTSDEILNLDEVPKSIIVLGGGIVASELAQFLSRIGTKVIQIQRSPHILKEASPQAATIVEQAFRDGGIDLITDTKLDRVEKTQDGRVRAVFQHQGQEVIKEADHLFNALGRKPNTNGLNLEAAGIELKKSGHIAANEFQQSVNPNVYAAGDVAGPHEIVHIAIMQGEIAAKHAFGQKTEPVDYDSLLGVIFTDPQVAHVGLTETQMKDRGIDFVAADYPFDDHGKSILMEAKYGYVKVYAEKGTGRLLAAECVGRDASELIHSMAVGVTLGARVQDMLKVHWYHPTLSEIWSYPLEEAAEAV
ncbi:NAD(P)/FAD-dependent oxidoreductase [Rubellicoccus peritrichatus]|uniref:NAD(P)/FAD-dependent oxidoreductase n=1 Tax=Rubellicoccus peritrichatus TaxID=3080537 RepID=A0AAQ3L8Z9_9BACT|nr:NAD(P)/FAD-dependent oxidoreductase [Puniceicoccus sp. CR14]WOO41301.1 NAD(P)/FAD-dependent oxidoreductase [Puniceicoccus sp. CR14]